MSPDIGIYTKLQASVIVNIDRTKTEEKIHLYHMKQISPNAYKRTRTSTDAKTKKKQKKQNNKPEFDALITVHDKRTGYSSGHGTRNKSTVPDSKVCCKN